MMLIFNCSLYKVRQLAEFYFFPNKDEHEAQQLNSIDFPVLTTTNLFEHFPNLAKF